VPEVSRHEPLAARLHFIPRLLSRVHARVLDSLRDYFERAPSWVILTTAGRKTGLPREVLLPCARGAGELIVISTFGRRSNWIRNLRDNPRVSVTQAGRNVPGLAEIVDDLERKRSLVSDHPFCPLAPFDWVHRLTAPVLPSLLRWWVTSRPVVVVSHQAGPD
jgi:deazaflavin-dependent oxidoreductase (nitroreductase family)